MASFKQHITFGALIGILGTTLLYFYAFVTDPILLLILCISTTIASFLPDLDSDSGVPLYLLFGVCSLGSAGLGLLYALQHYPDQALYYVGIPVGVALFVWVVGGGVFKHFTHHRGMMHSIPTMFIVALLTYLSAQYLGQGDTMSLIFAAAVAVGFLSHLVLDEVHAELNMNGTPFVTRRSLGTAMKLFSPSKGATLFTYLILAVLVYKAVTLS